MALRLAGLEPARPEPPRLADATEAAAAHARACRPPRPAPAPANADRAGSPIFSPAPRARMGRRRAAAGPCRAVHSRAKPLETISHDIARMVDHAAVAEAWDDYRRGDSHAFSRQLYIGRGPQTFEEIRRRYRGDVEFRNTVDRYVQEFERLLADVSRDDRDDTLNPHLSHFGDRQGLYDARACRRPARLEHSVIASEAKQSKSRAALDCSADLSSARTTFGRRRL